MMSSYPNSVDDDGLNQVTVKAEPDSLTITYAFGTNTEKQTICYVMSQKGYDQLAEKADRAIGEERISTSQFARFQNLYQAIVYDELDDADQGGIRQEIFRARVAGAPVCLRSYVFDVGSAFSSGGGFRRAEH